MAYRKNARQEGRPPRKSSGGPPGKPSGGYGKSRPARAAQGDRDQSRPNRPPGPGRPPGAHRPSGPGRPPGANRPPAPGHPPGKPGRAPIEGGKGERLQKILAHAGLGSRHLSLGQQNTAACIEFFFLQFQDGGAYFGDALLQLGGNFGRLLGGGGRPGLRQYRRPHRRKTGQRGWIRARSSPIACWRRGIPGYRAGSGRDRPVAGGSVFRSVGHSASASVGRSNRK